MTQLVNLMKLWRECRFNPNLAQINRRILWWATWQISRWCHKCLCNNHSTPWCNSNKWWALSLTLYLTIHLVVKWCSQVLLVGSLLSNRIAILSHNLVLTRWLDSHHKPLIWTIKGLQKRAGSKMELIWAKISKWARVPQAKTMLRSSKICSLLRIRKLQ